MTNQKIQYKGKTRNNSPSLHLFYIMIIIWTKNSFYTNNTSSIIKSPLFTLYNPNNFFFHDKNTHQTSKIQYSKRSFLQPPNKPTNNQCRTEYILYAASHSHYSKPVLPKGLVPCGWAAEFTGNGPNPTSPNGFCGAIIKCCGCGCCWKGDWYGLNGLLGCCWAMPAIWTDGGGAILLEKPNGSCTSNGLGAGAP